MPCPWGWSMSMTCAWCSNSKLAFQHSQSETVSKNNRFCEQPIPINSEFTPVHNRRENLRFSSQQDLHINDFILLILDNTRKNCSITSSIANRCTLSKGYLWCLVFSPEEVSGSAQTCNLIGKQRCTCTSFQFNLKVTMGHKSACADKETDLKMIF